MFLIGAGDGVLTVRIDGITGLLHARRQVVRDTWKAAKTHLIQQRATRLGQTRHQAFFGIVSHNDLDGGAGYSNQPSMHAGIARLVVEV